ncbi:hypothetical protein KKC97_13110 [bacterium]|nr:hypothetical protein [bacterium]MBU1638595.1 hypothetical protein [bacterium]
MISNYLDQYWKVQEKLGNYAPDLSDEFSLEIDGYEEKLSIDTYFSKLYVPRPEEIFEKTIEEEAPRLGRILCVCGEIGSGKTSAIEYACRSLKKNRSDLQIVKLDIKKLSDQLFGTHLPEANKTHEPDSIGAFEYAFRLLLRSCISQYLLYTAEENYGFSTWALAGPPDESENFDPLLLMCFKHLHDKVARFVDFSSNKRIKRIQILREYFRVNKTEFTEYEEKIESLKRTPHMIHYFLSSHPNFNKVFLVIDNVDRIPIQYHASVLTVCRDIRMAVAKGCAIVIGIRYENIRERGIPGADRFFEILSPDAQSYRGLLLPRVTKEHMQKVLDKRDKYAREFVERYHIKKGGKHRDEDNIVVTEYHKHIVSEFVDNKVHALANNSYLTLLLVYTHFLKEIWHRLDQGITNIGMLGKQDGHLQTLFYLWLQKSGAKVGIHMHNIIEYRYDDDATDVNEIASVQHLLLTCTYNITKELESKKLVEAYPKWNEISRRMIMLGFTYSNIHAALYEFLTPIGDPPGVLRFIHKEFTHTEINNISKDDTFELELTPRGIELVTSILDKVGFIWRIAQRSEEVNIPSGEEFYDFKGLERAYHVYEFTKLLAKKHLLFLSVIYDKQESIYHDNWLRIYRKRFGVNSSLQVERILSSAAKYFAHLFSKSNLKEAPNGSINPFYALLDIYQRILGEVERGSKFMDIRIDDRLKEYDSLFFKQMP